MGMRLAMLAIGVMLVIAVGVYIGLSGFQQYALESSRSRAGQALCAPDRPVSSPGRTVTFSVSGLPESATPHWSAREGRAGQTTAGGFSVIFSERGEQFVDVFFPVGESWQHISCSVTVR